MKIKIQFYKPSGKWYSSCEIDIDAGKIFEIGAIEKVIINHQDALSDSWIGCYHVTVENAGPDTDPFVNRLYMQHQFHKEMKE